MTAPASLSITPNMATTGRRFAQRTQDKLMRRVLDARTRAVLRLLDAPLPALPDPSPSLRAPRFRGTA